MIHTENQNRKVSHYLNNNYRYDIAILRLLCIVVVVYFHAYGMMYANHFSDNTRHIYDKMYGEFNQVYLINIAMPMFIFISGFLFGGQLMRKGSINLKNIIRGKVERLLVPYFVFSFIFMLTQNALSWQAIYQLDFSHLWFLPMLFWCFVITYFLYPLILSNNHIVPLLVFSVLFGISLLGKFVPPFLGIQFVNSWLCWFVLGFWFYKHERALTLPSVNKKIKAIIIVGGLIIYCMIMTIYPQTYGNRSVLGIAIIIIALYSLWLLFSWIQWQNFTITNFLLPLSACSFGIYIFHNWLEAHMVSQTAQRLLPLEQWAQEHVYLYPFLFSTVAFIISLAITWVILKSKVGRNLIG